MAQTEWFKKVAEECGCKEEQVRQVFRCVNNEFLKDKKQKLPQHEYMSQVMAKVKSELKKGLKESYLDKALNILCEAKIEAYGVKGMKNTKWRKVFNSQKEFEKWCDKNEGDIEVQGTRKLDEAVAKWYPTDDEIEAYAEKNNMSWGKAEKELAAKKKASAADVRDKKYWDNERKRIDKEDKRIEKENRPPKPKLTKAQYEKMCKGAAEDWMSDNPDYEGEDVWYDIADSMLYDKDVKDYINFNYYSWHKKLPGKQISREILADDIYSYASKIMSRKGK